MLAKSIRFHNRTTGAHSRSRRALFPARHDRGIALLLSLMLLALMSVMSVVMVMTVSPDMLINGYYGNFRGSFYAADSGLSMARQQLVNQVTGYVSTNACTGWAINIPAGSQASCGKAPLNIADNTTNATTAAADAASAIIANVLAPTSGGYGNYTSPRTHGRGASRSSIPVVVPAPLLQLRVRRPYWGQTMWGKTASISTSLTINSVPRGGQRVRNRFMRRSTAFSP